MGLSATATLFGVPPGTRTPTNSFGDCHAAITLEIHCLVEDDGIEPLGATLLVMPTGLQPAIGNILR